MAAEAPWMPLGRALAWCTIGVGLCMLPGGMGFLFAWFFFVKTAQQALHAVRLGGADVVRLLGRRELGWGLLSSVLAFFSGLSVTAVGVAGGAAPLLMVFGGGRRGRQVRDRGRTLLPEVGSGDEWTTAPMRVEGLDPALRRDLAWQWRENGRTEHASVVAFAQLSLDLMALGAPPDLVAKAHRDALDEVRHTELCFSLAAALDGRPASPGAFPLPRRAVAPHAPGRGSRTIALARLAVDSLVDGALAEGVSARMVGRLARRCEDPTIGPVLREIASDEGRHAAHGWEVVQWCVAEGGRPVVEALAAASRSIPLSVRVPLHPDAEGGAWEGHGVPGRALEAEAYARTRARIVEQVEALVAAPPDVAPAEHAVA